MADPDWKKIKAEYVRGASYRKLAKKYGVSFSSIQKRGAREKWTDLRNQSGRKTDEKIIESTSDQDAKRATMFKSISDKLLNKISDGIDDGSLILTCKGVSDLSTALKNLKELNDIKSDIDVREQEARIEKLRRDAVVEEQNNEIKVVIQGDLEEYSK